MRTGNRRSASTIISFELATIVFFICSHGESHRSFRCVQSLGPAIRRRCVRAICGRALLSSYQRDQACLLDPAAPADTHHLDEAAQPPDLNVPD